VLFFARISSQNNLTMQRKKTLNKLFPILGMALATSASAQTARVQIIHNCPDALAEVVDIYVNNDLALDDVAFRTATEFLNLPAETTIEVGIALGDSEGPGDILVSFNFDLLENNRYVIVANGIVVPDGYNPAPAFTLDVYEPGRTAASSSGNTDVLVMHGSTDAPDVDVVEIGAGAGEIISGLTYGAFTDYFELPTANYTLEVRRAGDEVLATYEAPLADLNLDGAALVVVASGFLDPSVNNNGPAFGLWAAPASGGALIELPLVPVQSTARLQVIHNSADAAAAVVDVYVNGGAEPFIDDFTFRTATPFTDVPAGVELEIGIAPGNSTGPQDIIPGLTFNFTLAPEERYVIVANGIVSPTGYNPSPAFDLDVFAPGQESASVIGNTDVLVVHGSTDAPTVQIAETAVLGGTVVVPPFSFGSFSTGYLQVPTLDVTLEVQLPDGTPVLAYDAPLATLGLEDAAIVALASGFLNPANNSDGPEFGIWVALPSGGNLIPLDVVVAEPTARVKIIHNSADAAAAVVDIYVNAGEEPAIDDLAFRNATGFLDLPAGVDLEIGIAPGNSTGPADIIGGLSTVLNLEDGETYIVVANGIVSASGYNPVRDFSLDVFAGARESATSSSNTDVLVFHGCTDAPVVDVAELAVPAGTVVNDLAYGSFAGYLELGTSDYALQVQTSAGAPVATYSAPLSTLGLDGAAITVVASGFLTPANNSNGPGFGLWVALADEGALVELPLILNVGVEEGVSSANLNAWPNPAVDELNLSVEATASTRLAATVLDLTGRRVLDLPSAALVAGENRIRIDLNAVPNGAYVLRLADGSSERSIPFQVAR
jgi:Domain of unknown function (DUF4397)/Secretion system C-terminal sorting domain